jgi:antitoxin MazE
MGVDPSLVSSGERHYQQPIRRWGNSLAVRLPADCLRAAGLQEGDQLDIVLGNDGRLTLQSAHRVVRRELVAELRQLQASMPITPSVIGDCRRGERW